MSVNAIHVERLLTKLASFSQPPVRAVILRISHDNLILVPLAGTPSQSYPMPCPFYPQYKTASDLFLIEKQTPSTPDKLSLAASKCGRNRGIRRKLPQSAGMILEVSENRQGRTLPPHRLFATQPAACSTIRVFPSSSFTVLFFSFSSSTASYHLLPSTSQLSYTPRLPRIMSCL